MYERLMDYFYQISDIPRCSGEEKAVREFLIDWAKNRGFAYNTDDFGNLVVYVAGEENKETIALQAHMDMVCLKKDGVEHDFSKEGIKILQENGSLKASGTTLGADNGIGIALALTLAEIDNHPPLELIFTVGEEVGLKGAVNLKSSLVTSQKLINLDSEEEDGICISSAGGVSLSMYKDLDFTQPVYEQYLIRIKGMKGGHSGVDIDKSRGNAIKFVSEFLNGYLGEFELGRISGGVADNAIPSEIELIVGVNELEYFKTSLNGFLQEYKRVYDCPEISYEVFRKTEYEKVIVDKKSFLEFINSIKTGVYSMSKNVDGLVETSNNLGKVEFDNETVKLVCLLRSSNNARLEQEKNNMQDVSEKYGFSAEINSQFPGWESSPQGELVQGMKNSFQNIFEKEIQLEAIHAGLECGIIVSKMGDGAEAVSIGPNIYDAHSVEERCEVKSVERIFEVVKDYLENF